MKAAYISSIAVVLGLAGSCALAGEAGRYQLQPTSHGIVRLDTQTGELAYCTESGGALNCKLAALDAALLDRIEALEERLASLERKRASGDLPTDEELEQGFSIMEKFLRRFRGLAEEFGQDGNKPEEEALPQRT